MVVSFGLFRLLKCKTIVFTFGFWYIARDLYIQDRRHLAVDQALGAGDNPRAIRAAPRPHPSPASRMGACGWGSGGALRIARGAQHARAHAEIELSTRGRHGAWQTSGPSIETPMQLTGHFVWVRMVQYLSFFSWAA